MKRYTAALVLLVPMLAGCRIAKVKVASDFPHEKIKKIVVLEFDHKVYKEEIVDKVSHGVSTSSNSGDIVADIVSADLEDWGRYEVVRRYKVREISRDKKIPEGELVYSLGLQAVGKLFGVDAIVVGRVEAFEFGFVLMVASGKVDYTARCIDVETGQEIWSFTGKLKKLYTYEEQIADMIAWDAIEQLDEILSGKKSGNESGKVSGKTSGPKPGKKSGAMIRRITAEEPKK